MTNKLANPIIIMLAVGLLVACGAITKSEAPAATQVFPTPTTHFLFQGRAPVSPPNSQVSLSGAPTIAGVFRTLPSATPLPGLTYTVTPEPEPTATPTRPAQLYTVIVYDETLNTNWEVQQDTKIKVDLKSSSAVHSGHAAISFTPRRRGEANLFIAVSDQTQEEYRSDQAAKLSFWLYSPKTLLYLDQFSITLVGSKRLPYWSAEDQKVSNYLSVFRQIRLDELGFDRAVPADTWVMVEIDLDKAQALAPDYQYLTGIAFKNATDPTHMLLIDDINLTLLGKPPAAPVLQITPTAQ